MAAIPHKKRRPGGEPPGRPINDILARLRRDRLGELLDGVVQAGLERLRGLVGDLRDQLRNLGALGNQTVEVGARKFGLDLDDLLQRLAVQKLLGVGDAVLDSLLDCKAI